MATQPEVKKASRCHDALSLLGCCFIILPNAIRLTWGNIIVYVTSYLYAQGGHDANDLNTPWVLSIDVVVWTMGIFLSVPLEKYSGRTVTILIGILLIDGGILLAYLSILLNSMTALNLVLGGVVGLGGGVSNAIIIVMVSELAGKHQGLMNSLVCSSNNLAAMPMNLLFTWYINPLNLTPELVVESNSFFTQTSVLDKTPSVFLVLLAVTVFSQTLGMIFMLHQGCTEKDKQKWQTLFKL